MPLLRAVNYYKGPQSTHFDGTHFFNPWNPRQPSFQAFLRWKLTAAPKPWPEKVVHSLTDRPPLRVEGTQLRVSFVGHATVLIQTQGLNILTDPIWSDRASPFRWTKIKRICPPGIAFEHLPPIDLVLVSHNHYDHLNLETLQQLWQRDRPRILTPLGNDAIIQAYDPSIAVETLDWEQSLEIQQAMTAHLLPTQHWSARGLRDRDKALWGAFALKTPGGNIYFAGDTGYGQGEVFHHAKATCGPFRLALLPIGSYEPRWFMRYAHMNPREAVQAHLDLGRPYTIAIHFGTFRLADEGYDDPIKELTIEKASQQVADERFRALTIGDYWEIPS